MREVFDVSALEKQSCRKTDYIQDERYSLQKLHQMIISVAFQIPFDSVKLDCEWYGQVILPRTEMGW